jgi:very-short-patch-repair endonuclease/DNA polymerase III delta prime subunit
LIDRPTPPSLFLCLFAQQRHLYYEHMATIPSTISSNLDKARKELLDLGLRNSLLSFKPSKTRGIEVVDGNSEQVFGWLVSEPRSLAFFALPEKVEESTRAALHAVRSTKVAVGLQSNLVEKSLKSRLLATLLAANAHIEERGSNILYLALGMLHWFEDDNSSKELRAPLLLVPVEMKRTSARDAFTLSYNNEEIEDNLSLATKLHTEFRVKLPELPDLEDLDIRSYFAAVAKATRGMNRWQVQEDEISLGFFSFGKFLMYRDLAPGHWIGAHNADGSPLMSALLRDGFHADPSPVGEDQYLDDHIAPNALHQVVDIDSSQALALLDIRGGRNLVIQGPPGTGKSQTITNLIADAIGQGKKVLFVAEKMAALEVVKRRLDKVGVGDACLELHSHTANKKALLGELKRTLQLGKPQLVGGRFNLGQYTQLRDQLTNYCNAVNEPVGDTTYTPYQLIGEIVAIRTELNGTKLPRLAEGQGPKKPMARDWVEQLATGVTGLERHLARMGMPSLHPFRHSDLTALLPTERQDLEAGFQDFLIAAERLEAALRDLSAFMGIQVKLDAMEALLLAKAGRRAISAPHLRDVQISAGDWQEQRDLIRDLLGTGADLSALRAEFDAELIPEAWDADLLAARQVLRTTGQKWWRIFSGNYRETRSQIVGLCAGTPKKDVSEQLRLVEAVMQAKRLGKIFAQHESLGAALFGVQWQGQQSDWPVLSRINDWIVELYRAIGTSEIPRGILEFLAGNPAVDGLLGRVETVEAALPAFSTAFPALVQRLALNQMGKAEVDSQPLDAQAAQVRVWLGQLSRLPEWITYNNMAESVRKAGLGWLVTAAHDWDASSQHLTSFFRHVAFEGILRSAYAEREALRSFSTATQEQVREQFAELDRACFSSAQLQLAMKHWEALPRSGGLGQMGILLREFEKRARHMPIRKLITEAGNVIQAIKPVFMMSPMSIATFLPPGAVDFDLVVFDEASQVKPVDAFGAVLRGRQLVVVGDSKQLPPTSFFDSLASDTDSDDDDDEEAGTTADMESILGLVAGQGAPQRMLRWHYRSRHESLIALSNKEFYDNRLVVFPSPESTKKGLGLVFHHLKDTAYDRGRSRTNRKEAFAVAQAVMHHAHKTPHLTLGVAAFSLTQADAIIDELERLRSGDPVAEAFFSQHPFEPFFVKNLESVQGDERDVILISVGYGKDENGYLSMSFGALNGSGGERRLNVLITRARLSCEVYSNITHDDIDLARTQARGVAAFKAFLKYAATGILDVPDAGRTEQDSVFEEQVADALERIGHKLVAQVGSGGFRIDLAVVDPDLPGRYLLGIECDGATYHSSRSARDRDRLREQVLVSLGWRIHRIWSTDWFADPDGEIKRVLLAIDEERVRQKDMKTTVHDAARPPTVAPRLMRSDARSEEDLMDAPMGGIPYVVAQIALHLNGYGLHDLPDRHLLPVIADIVQAEGPVHVDEVIRRLAEAVGVKRVGSRIEAAMRAAIRKSSRSGLIEIRGDFLWPPDETVGRAKPRDRSGLPASARKIELIAPEEIAAGIHQVVNSSYGINQVDIPVAVARLLGFSRTSDEITIAIASSVKQLIKRQQLTVDDGQVSLV